MQLFVTLVSGSSLKPQMLVSFDNPMGHQADMLFSMTGRTVLHWLINSFSIDEFYVILLSAQYLHGRKYSIRKFPSFRSGICCLSVLYLIFFAVYIKALPINQCLIDQSLNEVVTRILHF